MALRYKKTVSPALSLSQTFSKVSADQVELVALPFLPASPFNTVDSRGDITFTYDALSIVENFKKGKRKLPLDIEHRTEYGNSGTEAYGWIHEFSNSDMEPGLGFEPGVLYAWVELNPLGADAMANKLYGFTSAVVQATTDNPRHFIRAKSMTLTNNPATVMPQNFTAEDDEGGSYTDQHNQQEQLVLTEINQALGLADDADQAATLAAIGELKSAAATAAAIAEAGLTPDTLAQAAGAFTAVQAGEFVSAETFSTLKADAEALTLSLTAAREEVAVMADKLATLEAEKYQAACLTAVDAAIQSRKITPAQRDAMLALATTNLSAFTEAMSTAAEVVGDTDTPAEAADPEVSLTAEEEAFLKGFGFSKQSLIKAKQRQANN